MEVQLVLGIRLVFLIYAILMLIRIGWLVRGVSSRLATGYMLGVLGQITYTVLMLLNPIDPDIGMDVVWRSLLATTSASILLLCTYRIVKPVIHCISRTHYSDCDIIKEEEK